MSIVNRRAGSSIFLIACVAIAGFGIGMAGAHAMTRVHAESKINLSVRKVVALGVRPAAVSAPTVAKPAEKKAVVVQKKTTTTKKVEQNTIVIPRMGVNSAILEGKDAKTLNKGIWHVPGTSNPAKGGNVVISAHRYKWRPPSTKTFWDIDKMKVGDTITVMWEGVKYEYTVTKSYIVTPDRVDILANTKEHKLTLFSCTPKFTSKYRLVVEAEPVKS